MFEEKISSNQEDFVVKTFNQEARTYLDKYSDQPSIAHSFNIRRQRVCELLEDIWGGKVLDIGCGPGVMVEYFVKKEFEFYGIDPAEEMIEQCRNKFGRINSAHFSLGKIEKLEFPESYFDVIVCMGVVEYIKDNDIAIKEMTRVLKPGGVMVVTLPNIFSPYRIWNRIIYKNISKLLKILIKSNGHTLIHKEFKEKDYCRMLEDNGLKIVDVVYYNFQILFYPIDKWFSCLTVPISRKLESLCRSRLKWLGTGFIVKASKSNQP